MYDIAIIGAGPTGLFAGFQAGMLGMNAVIIDTLKYAGGQCSALYPEKPIYDIPAIPSIKAEDLTQNLLKQIEKFNHKMELGTFVESYNQNADKTFTLNAIKDGKKLQINAKSIIIAIGGGSFGPNRPPLEGIEKYEDRSVFYMINNKKQFEGKKIMIAGGGDSAVDWAILLAENAEVSIVHRRSKFRAHENSLTTLHSLIDSGKITLHTPYKMKSLMGNGNTLQAIELENINDESVMTHEIDYLLPFFGLSMDIGTIKDWGFEMVEKYINVDSSTMATNIDGIFAIGDIATYKGKLKLILCGFSEAAMACYGIRNYIHPNEAFHFEYSTTAFNK
ncbi:MAG: thioredoxin reductase (NADPH) [Candidatus Deianiraeaceae bacterium]|jgi:thioredoxin reductase (NADPH)